MDTKNRATCKDGRIRAAHRERIAAGVL